MSHHPANAARPATHLLRQRTLALAAIAAMSLQLTGCGGGGTEPSATSHTGTPDATAQAARSVELSTAELAAVKASMRVGHDATAAFDTLLQASSKITPPDLPTTPPPLPEGDAPATVEGDKSCPTGGSVHVKIDGTNASVLNPKPNSGEVYTLTFNACTGLVPGATLSGQAQIIYTTVTSDTDSAGVTHTESSGTWAASGLTVAGSSGSTSFTGQGEFSSLSDLNATTTGSTHTHFTSPSLTLTVGAGGYSVNATLNAVDLNRAATLVNEVTSTSSLSGSFQLVMPGGLPYVPVTIYGSLTYSSTGTLSSGSLGLTLPYLALLISQSSGVTTLQIDRGADGTVDRVITLP